MLAFICWFFLAILFYSYLGYGVVIYLLARSRRRPALREPETWPAVTHLIAAYNESESIDAKLANSLALHYPPGLLRTLVVTDGSTDDTPQRVAACAGVRLMHSPERRGKIAAVHRAMQEVDTPIVVFSDANTLLNPEAIERMVRHYQDPGMGVVAGEKRVMAASSDTASAAGEQIMILDDSDIMRRFLMQLLSKDMHIIEVADGVEALRIMRSGTLPDLILTDINMPHLDGIQLLEHMQASELLRNIPVIVLSGKDDSKHRIRSFQLGAVDYVVKPFNPVELKLRIDSHLQRIRSRYAS
ncbi:MAG: hypothetical protein OHK0039_42140 [Bacteroidia bacterium]